MISPICPFPPVGLLSDAMQNGSWPIDYREPFQKQSFRSRYQIATANGLLTLTIPTRSTGLEKRCTQDIEIANEKHWQLRHIRAIRSAYGSAPFFEFYFPAIEQLILSDVNSLGELFENSTRLWIKLLKVELPVQQLFPTVDQSFEIDWRIRGKQAEDFKALHEARRYLQVFADRFPFQGNLCIIDLLFNLGPQAANHLALGAE